MRVTTTLCAPDSGAALIDGERVKRNLTKMKQKLGIVPQHSNLERELSAAENLEFHGRLYGMKRAERRERAAELLEFAGLGERKNHRAKTFSGGMQRRLMLIKALMHRPQILLLDEPTVGLDAASRRKMWDLLRVLKKDGLTILLTTHYLEEAGVLCDTVGMIDCGKLRKTGSPGELIREAGNYVLECFESGESRQAFFDTKDAALRAAKNSAGDFKIREANLEDAFLQLTKKRLGP
jgi:ABC-2 type transport system ATP-binding protein